MVHNDHFHSLLLSNHSGHETHSSGCAVLVLTTSPPSLPSCLCRDLSHPQTDYVLGCTYLKILLPSWFPNPLSALLSNNLRATLRQEILFVTEPISVMVWRQGALPWYGAPVLWVTMPTLSTL